MVEVTITCRSGRKSTFRYTQTQALARIAYLEGVERRTQEVAWSDSGNVRDEYEKEREALCKALDKPLVRFAAGSGNPL